MSQRTRLDGRVAYPTGAGTQLADLARRHSAGENVTKELINTLKTTLPNGVYPSKSSAHGWTTVRVEAADDLGVAIEIGVRSSYEERLVGGDYGYKTNFALAEGLGEHSVIDRFEFEGGRLTLRLRRDAAGRKRDGGTKYQELKVAFGSDGELDSFAVSTKNGGFSRRRSLDVPVAK